MDWTPGRGGGGMNANGLAVLLCSVSGPPRAAIGVDDVHSLYVIAAWKISPHHFWSPTRPRIELCRFLKIGNCELWFLINYSWNEELSIGKRFFFYSFMIPIPDKFLKRAEEPKSRFFRKRNGHSSAPNEYRTNIEHHLNARRACTRIGALTHLVFGRFRKFISPTPVPTPDILDLVCLVTQALRVGQTSDPEICTISHTSFGSIP